MEVSVGNNNVCKKERFLKVSQSSNIKISKHHSCMCSIETLRLLWTGSTRSWQSYLQNAWTAGRLSLGVHVLAVRVIDLALLQRSEV